MSKNILVFADGTGNEGGIMPDESRTNVYKLYRATRSGPDSPIDPGKQICFYIHGIGTPEPGKSLEWRDTVHQMFGGGLTKRIVEGYSAIVSVWRPGDRIYLFGFSRGAYTARCIAHVVELFGIPQINARAVSGKLDMSPAGIHKVCKEAVRNLYFYGYALKDSDRRSRHVNNFRAKYSCITDPAMGGAPYFIGVWDTVAAVGWSKFLKRGYDLHLPKTVRFARHAMAIDEFRKDFARVPWGGTSLPPSHLGEPPAFEQIWFAGNHSDIGGSYPENESRLSDISLQWMTEFIEVDLPVEARISINRDILKLFPSSDGITHDECMVGIGGTPLKWYPIDRNVPPSAVLHASVYERLKMAEVRNFTSIGPYRPASLRNHDKAKEYFKTSSNPA